MEEFLKEYLTILRYEKNLSENTTQSYKNDLKKFLTFLAESKVKDLSEVTSNLITKFFDRQRKSGVDSATSARYMSSIKGFFRFLENSSYIEKNPTEKLSRVKKARKLPSVLTLPEIEMILNAPKTDDVTGQFSSRLGQ